MKIILTAMDTPLFEAWKKYCGKLDCVEVLFGSIFDAKCDAVVSPANSFGFMDGGIDWTYSQRFGWGIETKLQRQIRESFNGELLVGQATCVRTNEEEIQYVISAPTMRVPCVLDRTTVNPYLAAKAALRCALNVYDVETLAFPGLGTGVGKVLPEVCANQMRAAIEEVIYHNDFFPYSWDDAVHRHKHLALINE